jgi:hypothetical protein
MVICECHPAMTFSQSQFTETLAPKADPEKGGLHQEETKLSQRPRHVRRRGRPPQLEPAEEVWVEMPKKRYPLTPYPRKPSSTEAHEDGASRCNELNEDKDPRHNPEEAFGQSLDTDPADDSMAFRLRLVISDKMSVEFNLIR